MSQDWCQPTADGVRLALQVLPNAKKTEVVGLFDGLLKIRLQAPAIEGRANEALLRYLAQRLEVPKSALQITHGQSGRRKLVAVKTGAGVEAVRQALLP